MCTSVFSKHLHQEKDEKDDHHYEMIVAKTMQN